MDGDDGVERVGLVGEHGLRFEFFSEALECGDLAGEIGLRVLALTRKLEVGFDVVGAASEL